MILECSSCGAQYPSTLAKLWGKTVETNGYGAQMCCTALVPNGLKAPGGEEAREACRGLLGALPDNVADAQRAIALTLNDGRKVDEATELAVASTTRTRSRR